VSLTCRGVRKSMKHSRHVRGVFVIYDDDMPRMATHEPQRECGYSVYRGVLVQWDEDQDGRVFSFIDSLSDIERENLAIAQEHEAVIALRWKHYIPHKCSGLDVEGDIWVVESRLLDE
jgi:hypothetical protein